ncbi:MAG: TolB family protein [Nocardioidaceae bacterium]
MRRILAVAAVFAMAMTGLGTAFVAPTSASVAGANGAIVFAGDLGLGFQLYSVDQHGKGFRQLTDVRGDATAADWSPDGSQIVFEHDFYARGIDHGQIMLMNADGSDIRHVTKAGLKHQPSFTPDGGHLVYECECSPQGIFIMRTDGSDRRRLSTNPFPDEGDGDPNVSPDGTTVTFVRHKVDGELQALYAVDIDGRHVRRLVPYGREVAIKHDWAPDGSRIVITTNADYPGGRSPNVATVRPDGSDLQMLTHFKGGSQGGFVGSYSPNGRWIVFRVENLDREQFGLYKMRPDGSDKTLISALPFAPRSSDWGPRPAVS